MADLLDAAGRAIAPQAVSAIRNRAMLAGSDRAHRAASYRDQALGSWTPFAGSADIGAIWDRDAIVARVRDLIRNNGIARAAVVKQADMVVGRQWRLMSIPDADALGLSRKEAARFGKAIETAFRKWAEDPMRRCDRARRHNFAGLVNLLYREERSSGEALAVLRDKPRPGWAFRTAVQVIDADRLSNPAGRADAPDLKGGVALDEAGEPLGYHIRQAHPYDVAPDPRNMSWVYVPRETDWGRPVCIHGFESDRVEQTRGVSPFASILAPFKMLDRHADAEINSAVANALFVAFVSSSYDPYQVAESLATVENNPVDAGKSWQDIRMDIYKGAPVMLGENRIPVLPPGDEIKLNDTPRQTSEFASFRASFLQEIASALGMPYIALAERWDGVNYSSARAALNEVWRAVTARRAAFVEQVVTPIYLAVLEEILVTGMIDIPAGVPGFYDEPAAWSRGIWIGPGRGYVDPQKEAQASKLRLEANLSTMQRELAEQGLDFEEVVAQRARELETLAEFELGEFFNGADDTSG